MSSHVVESFDMSYTSTSIKQEPSQDLYKIQTYEHQSYELSETYMEQKMELNEDDELQSRQDHSPDRQNLDDVGIHDDLAISDSDEGDDDLVNPKEENVDNDNDDDGDGLWF